MFVLRFILCSLSQCFAAYGRTCAQSKTFAFVLAVVLNVAGSKGGRLKAVFTLVFCALAAGDDAAFEVGVVSDLDLIAVITCVNAALFGNSSISLLLLNYCSLCFCYLLPTTYFR